ncbi:hypothetical protein ES705_42109 [subsurface metagenome]
MVSTTTNPPNPYIEYLPIIVDKNGVRTPVLPKRRIAARATTKGGEIMGNVAVKRKKFLKGKGVLVKA